MTGIVARAQSLLRERGPGVVGFSTSGQRDKDDGPLVH